MTRRHEPAFHVTTRTAIPRSSAICRAAGPDAAPALPARRRALRPPGVILVDQLARDRPKLGVEIVEVSTERHSLERALDLPSDESAEAAMVEVLLDPAGKFLGPLTIHHGSR